MAAKPTGEPGWKWRRWLIFPVCVFAAYELDMLRQTPDVSVEVLKLLVYVNAVTLVCVVFFYTGFATIQDAIAIIKTARGLPYKDDPPVITDTIVVAQETRPVPKEPATPDGKIEGL